METTGAAELIDTGERRDARGRRMMPAARRAEYVRAYQTSGLTQAAFARREGLGYSTFAHWVQQELKKAGLNSPMQFAELRLPLSAPAPASGANAGGLEVRLPDGTMLRGGNVTELVKLVRALRA